MASFTRAEEKFEESQRARIEHLEALKVTGDNLLFIREALAEATPLNPIETDLGTFTSFADYLDNSGLSFSSRSAYHFIKLAENWHIVEALGMQNRDQKSIHKAMRLSRTLKVIKWAQEKLEGGAALEQLSFDLYWQEEEGRLQRARELRAETVQANITPEEHRLVVQQVTRLREENQLLSQRIEELEAELNQLRKPKQVPPDPFADFKTRYKQSVVSV